MWVCLGLGLGEGYIDTQFTAMMTSYAEDCSFDLCESGSTKIASLHYEYCIRIPHYYRIPSSLAWCQDRVITEAEPCHKYSEVTQPPPWSRLWMLSESGPVRKLPPQSFHVITK